jgi:hypothetical protein
MKLASVLSALALAGCFSPANVDCAFRCGAGDMQPCPDDYECRSDGYCHLIGAVGACTDASMDGSGPPDLTATVLVDQASPPQPDLAVTLDFTLGTCSDGIQNGAETDVDCGGGTVTGCPLCANGKMCVHDGDCQSGLCMNRVCAPRDMTFLPDLTCVASQCTSPPTGSCVGAQAMGYANPGICDANGACMYPMLMKTCSDGCFGGVCTGAFQSIGPSTALALGVNVPLASTGANQASTGGGPVSHTSTVTVATPTAPGGTVQAVDLFWSLDPRLASGVNQVSCLAGQSTQQTDYWGCTIPAQAAGVEVYFWIRATTYAGGQAAEPAAGGVHYAYAVN